MIDQKKANLIENQPDDLGSNTASTIKAEEPWDTSKSQILYGSLMSN
jgi:hypothetical protein